jgi:hypothetical protein
VRRAHPALDQFTLVTRIPRPAFALEPLRDGTVARIELDRAGTPTSPLPPVERLAPVAWPEPQDTGEPAQERLYDVRDLLGVKPQLQTIADVSGAGRMSAAALAWIACQGEIDHAPDQALLDGLARYLLGHLAVRQLSVSIGHVAGWFAIQATPDAHIRLARLLNAVRGRPGYRTGIDTTVAGEQTPKPRWIAHWDERAGRVRYEDAGR